jgi:hypothetical protein
MVCSSPRCEKDFVGNKVPESMMAAEERLEFAEELNDQRRGILGLVSGRMMWRKRILIT